MWSWYAHGKASASLTYVTFEQDHMFFKAVAAFDRLPEVLIPLVHLILVLLEEYSILYEFSRSKEISNLSTRLISLRDKEMSKEH